MFGQQIDLGVMQNIQQMAQICASHPECKDCQLDCEPTQENIQKNNGMICETAIMKRSNNGQ